MICLTLTIHLQAEVFAKIQELFEDAPDLASAFRDFLPGVGSTPDSDSLRVPSGPNTRSSNTRCGQVGGIYAKLCIDRSLRGE